MTLLYIHFLEHVNRKTTATIFACVWLNVHFGADGSDRLILEFLHWISIVWFLRNGKKAVNFHLEINPISSSWRTVNKYKVWSDRVMQLELYWKNVTLKLLQRNSWVNKKIYVFFHHSFCTLLHIMCSEWYVL